jgi:DHA3 family tetracycline resistance protein-like MFS transporter
MRRADPKRLYYALEFAIAMTAGWVVFDLYLVRVLELSPLQLILMGTAMEATIFLCEVPTGVVADTYSRRLSYIIGVVGMGLAVLGVGLVSAPWLVIALWAGWGFSYTFTSGSYQAWITDEIGVENVGSLFLRGMRVRLAGSLVGLGLCVVIGLLSLRAAVIGSGVVEVLCGLACIAVMPENGFRRRPRSERQRAWRELRQTATTGVRYVRAQTLVLLLVATELFAGFGAEAFDRLTEAHVIRDVGFPGWLNPVLGFGAVTAATMLFAFLAVGRVIRRVDRGGTPAVARLLVLFTLSTIAMQIVFAVAGTFYAVMAAFLAALVSRSLLAPLYDTWLNRQITDSAVRATVLSISGQANAIGQATGGPVLGVIGNAVGIPAALVAGALTSIPAAGLYARALRHGGREPELAALPQPGEA